MELRKPYSQIVCYLCIGPECKEIFNNHCCTAISAEFKKQAE